VMVSVRGEAAIGWALPQAGCSPAIAPAATVVTNCRRGRRIGAGLFSSIRIFLVGSQRPATFRDPQKV
jgi:hypothetical protein